MSHPDRLSPPSSSAPDAEAKTATSVLAEGEELRMLLTEWSGAGEVFPRDPSLSARFEAQVAATPDRIAATFRDEQLSYAELNRRANQLAHFLHGRGVVPGSIVALFLERRMELVVAILGVLKAGAAYLPMDVSYPADRVAFIVGDAQAALVITAGDSGDSLAAGETPVLRLDREWGAIAEHADSNPATVTTAESLAYVIYTSGSTGTPKGCEVTHGNATRLFESTKESYSFSADDVWTFFHSPAFDFSVWEFWGPLLHGGRLVVVPHDVSRFPDQFLALLVRERVTFLSQTPSAFKQLTAAVIKHPEPIAFALRYVVLGGEPLAIEPLRPWIDRFGDEMPRLVNGYGPTETTVFATFHRIRRADLDGGAIALIGRPIADVRCFVLDEERRVCAVGTPGELYIGGAGVTRGYLRRAELTAARFIDWSPIPDAPSIRLYASGDLARWVPGGLIEYQGRIDQQVKLRGFRIELGEIESVLARVEGVTSCAIDLRHDRDRDPRLVAYLVTDGRELSHAEIRHEMERALPAYMLPSAFVTLAELPMTTNGKLDRRALPAPERARPALMVEYEVAANALERSCCDAFAAYLQLDRVGRNDNFFDLGGDSLLAVQVTDALAKELEREIPAGTIFAHATPATLALALSGDAATSGHRVEVETPASPVPDASPRTNGAGPDRGAEPIALIGLAGRLPGADTVDEFWANLLEGRDSVTTFTRAELDASVPAELLADSAYVSARSVLRDPEGFDPAFFGLSQREADIMDPQQRLLLELAWEVLERAGYPPDGVTAQGFSVGVFAGVYSAEYLRRHVYAHPEVVQRVGDFAAMLATDKDYVATRIAHRLNLMGPAINVQSACSTSLVAIVQALDSLRAGRCDMAIAGGAAMTYPPRSGYLYQEGAMLSRDGVTRTFDASATGTVFGDGGAVVLMKRLSRAIADGDQIYAVIRGAGLNNDGGQKASFTAPTAVGQANVISQALHDANVDARSISYVEAHGTATPLGDPIEIEGLTTAYRRGLRGTFETGYCRIGSAKSNIGHVVAAAGAVGVIKTALSLAHETIPATLHYTAPNPKIDFAQSPFVVNDRRTPWPRSATPRRAGVSAFGVGGTNAHVVMEEAPLLPPSPTLAGPHVLRLSAKTPTALARMASALAAKLRDEPSVNMADVAYTLRYGRSSFAHRLCVVADSAADAVAALEQGDHARRATAKRAAHRHQVLFAFPGQGAQYPGMGRELYESERVFREACDRVFAALDGVTAFDLKVLMFSTEDGVLMETAVTQPATFCLEYALAQLWLSRGIKPAAMIGHSIGEFVAAVIAGVMPLTDAARLVARRGALMNALPSGQMLSVRLNAESLTSRLPSELSIAAVNGPQASVVAGPADAIAAFASTLEADGVPCRRLQTSHAFHSAMMDPVVEPFLQEVAKVPLAAPRIPIISTVTGATLTTAEATDPSYWATHLRRTVQFSSAVETALRGEPSLFLEVGPRHTLCTLVRQHPSPWSGERVPVTVPSLLDGPISEREALALAVGQLWLNGIDADTTSRAQRRRVLLPTYPFERVRCWLDAAESRPLMPIVAPVAPSLVTPLVAPVAIAAAAPIAPTPAPAVMSASSPVDRRSALISKLVSVFEDVGGLDLGDADPTASFVELGFDSLVLTQAAIRLKKSFSIAITFRQLMEEYRSLDALAAHLEATLPPEALPAAPVAVMAPAAPATAMAPSSNGAPNAAPVVAAWPAALPAPAGDATVTSFAQHVIQQQLAIMQQQMALLAGGGMAMPAVAAPAPLAAPAPTAHAPAPAPAASTPDMDSTTAPSEEAALAHTRYDVKKAFGAIARIHTRPSHELSEKQKRRLENFLRRYESRTAASKAYTVTHRAHLADPRVVNGFRPQTKEICYQVVVQKSRGSHMWDLDGNEYVDALCGFGMNLFGWQPDFVNEAVKHQIDEGHDIGPQHPLAGEVAQLVCELTGFDRAGLCNTGSEAVLGAIRIARTVTGRDLVVIFTGSYHGIFDEVLVRGTKKLRAVPAAPGILQAAVENVLVLDYGTPESLEIIRSRAHELAAVLIEPVQSRRPEFQPVDYLREVRTITEQAGTVLIFDEVITGFRAHPRGVQGLFGIQADLASYGKVIGGGYPIGVIAGKRQFMDALDGGAWQYGDDSIPTVGVTYFAGTFVRHPLALAACKAALLHLKEAGATLQATLTEKTTAMAARMNAFARAAGAPLEVRHFASLWRIAFTEEHPLQDLLWAMMRHRGIHILDNFPCFLTTAHTDVDIAAIVDAFTGALTEMITSEFLPGTVPAQEAPAVASASAPPVPNARLGRDRDGSPAWFVPDPKAPGGYVKLTA